MGMTVFPDDGSTPIVWLNIEVPMAYLPTVLAEELAHAVVGADAGHGTEFERVMEELIAQTQALMPQESEQG